MDKINLAQVCPWLQEMLDEVSPGFLNPPDQPLEEEEISAGELPGELRRLFGVWHWLGDLVINLENRLETIADPEIESRVTLEQLQAEIALRQDQRALVWNLLRVCLRVVWNKPVSNFSLRADWKVILAEEESSETQRSFLALAPGVGRSLMIALVPPAFGETEY